MWLELYCLFCLFICLFICRNKYNLAFSNIANKIILLYSAVSLEYQIISISMSYYNLALIIKGDAFCYNHWKVPLLRSQFIAKNCWKLLQATELEYIYMFSITSTPAVSITPSSILSSRGSLCNIVACYVHWAEMICFSNVYKAAVLITSI